MDGFKEAEEKKSIGLHYQMASGAVLAHISGRP